MSPIKDHGTMSVDAGRKEEGMGKELTTAELEKAVPCPRGSITYLALKAGIRPLRHERRGGHVWKIWPACAVPAIRRVRKERPRIVPAKAGKGEKRGVR